MFKIFNFISKDQSNIINHHLENEQDEQLNYNEQMNLFLNSINQNTLKDISV
jgi:hypothetical protein